jgi:hypothetical protein
MRLVCIVLIFSVSGCSSHTESSQSSANTESKAITLTTSKTLVHVDGSSGDEHPLVCGADGDFPAGHELAFRQADSGDLVHAVFPEGITPPKSLDGKFVLRGHFQNIQNMARYTRKIPSQDHRYFVVSSWERGE